MNSISARALCKSGRLKGRQVTLRRFKKDDPKDVGLGIHQTLHHPNIVSILSFFVTATGPVHILELCSLGCLADYLDSKPSRILTIEELRLLTRNLADALIYLKRELVIHCNLSPDTILVAERHTFKLTGFDSSLRLETPTSNSYATVNLQTPMYAAPELRARKQFGFLADVWSLGCVMAVCIMSSGSFNDVINNDDQADKFLEGCNREDMPQDGRMLVADMLKLVPSRRPTPSDIIQHGFLNNCKPQEAVRITDHKIQQQTSAMQVIERRVPTSFTGKPGRRHASDPIGSSRWRLRSILSETADLDATIEEPRRPVSNDARGPAKRIVSGPADLQGRNNGNDTGKIPSVVATRFHARGKLLTTSLEDGLERLEQEALCEQYLPADLDDIPVGTERPKPLNAMSMRSQTHKTVHGTITILPSHSLLVDFRERQRRHGQKGDTIMVISGDGSQVSLYSAPHLSTPCCLLEPSRVYTLDKLPVSLWKTYNDAARLLEQVKQRTPLLVVYTSHSKCTLMSNNPVNDVEILFYGSLVADNYTLQISQKEAKPMLRLRLIRHSNSLELAKRTADSRGEQWVNRTLVVTSEAPYVSPDDWPKLDRVEESALCHLSRFLDACTSFCDFLDSNLGSMFTEQRNGPVIDLRYPATGSSSSSSNTFFVNVTPRPPKIATARLQNSRTDAISNSGSALDGASSGRAVTDGTCCSSSADEARFIPSVGWCIRYPSQISQCGRYKMMFLDGTVMEVDVDEDWAEVYRPPGTKTRHKILECAVNKDLAERMQKFKKFVLLFDQSG